MKICAIFLSLLFSSLVCEPILIQQNENHFANYSLINSVDFHPYENLFAVTYTHNNKIVLYKVNDVENMEVVQTLSNPQSRLSHPQHAAFSKSGNLLIAANWTNETFTFYQRQGALYREIPNIFPFPVSLLSYKPHGIATSPTEDILAVAFGVNHHYGKAIALFYFTENSLELLDVLKELPGIPKGIIFSPDGNSLLVTFADLNCVLVFDLVQGKILSEPRQTFFDKEISRPEDIKISSDGTYCAISNSDIHTVTFYPFKDNHVEETSPNIMQHPFFPHGLAFSKDGKFLVVTQFGLIKSTPDGDVLWTMKTKPNQAKVSLYKLLKPSPIN